MSYRVAQANDRDTMQQVEKLLCQGGIQKDANLDYTCADVDSSCLYDSSPSFLKALYSPSSSTASVT